MDFSLEFAAYFAFIILPFLAIVNAVAAGLFVGFVLNFFKDTILMRLLKVFLVPAVFVAYLLLLYQSYFDLDFWLEGVLSETTWMELTFMEQFFASFPLAAYIIIRVIFYVLGWPGHEAEEESSSM